MKQEIKTSQVASATGVYSQAVEANGFIFVSGQLPIDNATGEMPADITNQTHQSLKNLKYILEEAGCSLDNIVKTTVFISDMGNFAKMNDVYITYFGMPVPARSAFAVKELPKGALIEIEAIAAR